MSATTARPFFLTSIGKKYLMGVAGLIWSGFVLIHMAGNMLILVGADAYNRYGHAITHSPILYPAEIILLLALVTHVTLALILTAENRRAHGGSRYAVASSSSKKTTLASRTMAVQGSIVLVFIILHLATFKYGPHYETTVDGVPMRDLSRLVVEVFKQPGYVVWYVVALLCLLFHLSHGVGSVFQSFGLKSNRTESAIKKFSYAYAVIVILGFLSQPLYVYFFAG
jgi:succinate dehydrogenase / fumarate reductase cytochrome b subunit